jgi:hypothetical protein
MNIPSSLSWKAMFSLFFPLVKRLEYLKSVTKMRNLPAENEVTLFLPAVLWHRECENISSVTGRNDFIMQDCYVKKWETVFQYASKLQEKIKKSL